MSFIDIHSHQSLEGFCIVQQYESTYAESSKYVSLGVHPWHADEKINWNNFELACANKNVLLIGECGLDSIKGPDQKIQEEVFLKQISISNKLSKPIVIHSVRSFERCLFLLQKQLNHHKVIFHGIRNKYSSIEKIIQAGFFISFGESLLHSDVTIKTFKQTPLNQIFLETDDSNISIELIYKKAAEIKSISEKKLQQQIISNFENLFGKNNGYFMDE